MKHEVWMQRCLELALNGAGHVAPNPMVGCVIVHNHVIIGEGWHQAFGGPHAEVNAIASVKNKELLGDSTLYVNLEPCSHHGKTPPCADLIISENIRHVVIGMVDPNPLVSGQGIGRLKQAGIEVECNILEHECRAINKRFLTWIEKKRPYVILKWAQTMNGFIAPDASAMSREEFEQARHITGKVVQKLVHRWRTEEAAIMVATRTALLDDPALNARAWPGKDPLRIVIDRELKLPRHLKVFDDSQHTWVLNQLKEEESGQTHYIRLDVEKDWFSQLLQKLYEANMQSLIIEGGAKLLDDVIANHNWDEAIVFYSDKTIHSGIAAPLISGQVIQQTSIDGINMIQYQRA